jgi:hypothetical protein
MIDSEENADQCEDYRNNRDEKNKKTNDDCFEDKTGNTFGQRIDSLGAKRS